MAKLSDAQINAIKFFATGEGTAPRKNTRDSLVTNGLLNENDTVTTDGYRAAGIKITVDVPETTLTATVEDVLTELDTNPWDFIPVLPNGWDMRKRNRDVWKGLSQEEITADIATARPVANRKDIRSGNVLKSKHF